MKLPIYVLLISLFLEIIFTNLVSINSNLFIPVFSVIGLIIIYPYFKNEHSSFFKYSIVFGLVYDLIFSNYLFYHLVLFLIISYLIYVINIFVSNNAVNVILMGFVIIAFYRIIGYFILVIIGYLKFSSSVLFKSIYSSLILNLIYVFILYLITDYISKKYEITKID